MSLDLRGLASGTAQIFEEVVREAVGPGLSAGQAKDLHDGSVEVVQLRGVAPSVSPLKPGAQPGEPRPRDPLFEGAPMADFEWSQEGVLLAGNLYPSPHSARVFSGRLRAKFSVAGLGRPEEEGFPVPGALAHLPTDCQQVVAVDAGLLRVADHFRKPLEATWGLWEIQPLRDLLPALGPALIYARWRGDALFSFAIKDPAVVEKAIAKRFPASVIKTSTRWSYGAEVRGFDPKGPAWVTRGDYLLATTVGGTSRLDSALAGQLAEGRGSARQASPLKDEMARLAATQPGWHIVVVMEPPGRGLHWAALIRWPEGASEPPAGFLVVEPVATPPGSSR